MALAEVRRPGRFRSRVAGAKAAVLIVIVLSGLWLFSSALLGGKVLAGDDLLLFTSPMSEVLPPGLTRPSNPFNYDSAHVFHPDLIAARRAIRNPETVTTSTTAMATRKTTARSS